MVRLSLLLAAAAVIAPAIANDHVIRLHKRDPLEQRQNKAAAPTPTFTGTVPASVASLIATITSGTGNAQATQALATTFAPGSQNPSISNAPPLPTGAITPSDWPALDVLPPTDSAQAKKWLAALDLSKVPNIPQTSKADYGCESNPVNAAAAQQNGWWTCGGWTRTSDITTCPDKNTWGLSYDDGPSPYTPQLLSYLDQHKLKSTFFIVGSRAISRPEMLQTEYMSGHELSVHTWSHPPLTTLTNEQIVVELAWTREAIRYITGVSPLTMRPPYGDIDDRVRAICKLMNLTPVIWTSQGTSNYDTEDWQIAGGVVTSTEVVVNFENIIKNATQLDTGYIVLAHDLYQQSVDISTEVILPFAAKVQPQQNLMPIITCLKKPLGDAYVETNRNTPDSAYTVTGTGASPTGTAQSVGGGSKSSTGSKPANSGTSAGGSSGAISISVSQFAAVGATLFFGVFALL